MGFIYQSIRKKKRSCSTDQPINQPNLVLDRVERESKTCQVFVDVCAPIRESHPLYLSCLQLSLKVKENP